MYLASLAHDKQQPGSWGSVAHRSSLVQANSLAQAHLLATVRLLIQADGNAAAQLQR